MKDPNFFDFNGNPKEGASSTRTEVSGDNPLTKQQFTEMKGYYAKFCEMKNLSLAKTFNVWNKLSDGSLVHIRSAFGQDRVTVTPAGGKAIAFQPRFRGFIISDDVPWGWINEDDPGTNTDPYEHKANRRWPNYPFTDSPPASLGFGVNEFDAAGEVTWTNADLKYSGLPLVVSWRGSQNRQGFFRPKTETPGPSSILRREMSFWGPEYWHKVRVRRPNQAVATPGIPGTLLYSYYTVAADWGPSDGDSFVWINGMPVNAPARVACAAIRKKVDGLYLRIAALSDLSTLRIRVYEAKLPPLKTWLRAPMAWPRQLSWDLLWSSSTFTNAHRHPSLSFNKSATKVCGIFAEKVGQYAQGSIPSTVPTDKVYFVPATFSFGISPVPTAWTGYALHVQEFNCETLALGAYVYPSTQLIAGAAYNGFSTSAQRDTIVGVSYFEDDLVYFYLRHFLTGQAVLSKLYRGVNGSDSEFTTLTGDWGNVTVLGDFGRGDFVLLYTSFIQSYADGNYQSQKLRMDCYIDNALVSSQTVNVYDPNLPTYDFRTIAIGVNPEPPVSGTQMLNLESSLAPIITYYLAGPSGSGPSTFHYSPFPPYMIRVPDKSAFAQAYGPAAKDWKYMHIRIPDYTGAFVSFTHLSRDGVAKTWPDYAPGANEFILSPVFLSSQ